MNLFNNELIAYSLSNKKGDPNTYHDALKQVLIKKALFSILIKVPYTLQRNSMNPFPLIIAERKR